MPINMITLSQKQRIFSFNLARFICWLHTKGVGVTIGEVWRSKETQQIYVNKGLSKTLNSKHCDKLAADLNFFIKGILTYDYDKIKPYADYWLKLNPSNRWGGNFQGFPDTNHFEMVEE
jgi:hypothetical protein